jgi:hypothetical protein
MSRTLAASGPLPSTIISQSQFFPRARAREESPSRELWMREIQLAAVLWAWGESSSSLPPRLRTAATATNRISNSDHETRP